MIASNKPWRLIAFGLILSLFFITYMMLRNTQTIGNLTSQIKMFANKESSLGLLPQHPSASYNSESLKKLSQEVKDLYDVIKKERNVKNEKPEVSSGGELKQGKKDTVKKVTQKKPEENPEPQESEVAQPKNDKSLAFMTEGLTRLKNMPARSMAEVEYRFYNVTYYDDGKCGPDRKYYGPAGDGGYTVCLSEPFKFKRGDCIVYDFGINNMWQFDDQIVRDHNCHVYAFDPTMGVSDHKRGQNISFYGIGLSGKSDDRRWSRVMNLKGILEYLHHTNTIIDLMKFDIEWSEWDLMETIMKDGSFKNIKQIIFETHVNFDNETFENFRRRAEILINLRKTGMKQWHHRDNQWKPNIKRSKHTSIDRICCVEHSMVNSNFQN